MNTDYQCLKSLYICYIFFAIDDVIMTSATEDKYFIKSLRENKKYGAKRLLRMFTNKHWSVGGLKALIKIDNPGTVVRRIGLGSGRPRTVRTVHVLSIF